MNNINTRDLLALLRAASVPQIHIHNHLTIAPPRAPDFDDEEDYESDDEQCPNFGQELPYQD
jgi:hypothetical protein